MTAARTEVFRLSDIGEGLTEAEITAWRVGPGDTVTVNQILLDIETAKVAVELPSPFAGTVTALHAAVGDVVRVGGALVSIAVEAAGVGSSGEAGGSAPAASASAASAPAGSESETPETPSVLVGSGPQAAGVARRPRHTVPGSAHSAAATPRIAATPAARARAQALGLALADIAPRSPELPITAEDVERAAAGRVERPHDPDGATRTPIAGVRRLTAEAMTRSAFTAPHAAEWVSVDVTELMARLDALRHASAGVPVTPLAFVARALVRAVAAHPEINASWDAEHGEIVQFRDVNLGIACATPRGLIVPNVRAAQTMDFLALASALAELVHRARLGATTLDEVRHGTLSLTNIGGFGVDGGIPILNPGEAAILCMGQIREQPWVVDHALAVRSVLTLTLCFDHRLIDGALGSRVLRDIADALEQPEILLGDTPDGAS